MHRDDAGRGTIIGVRTELRPVSYDLIRPVDFPWKNPQSPSMPQVAPRRESVYFSRREEKVNPAQKQQCSILDQYSSD